LKKTNLDHISKEKVKKFFIKSNEKSLVRPVKEIKISIHAWKMLAILSCLATMVMYAETMLIPGIPNMIKDFHISYGMSSWILTSYLIAGAVITPIAGSLSDIYGKKKVLLVIMIIYAIGVSMAGLSTDIITLLIARTVQGIGISMFPIAFGIIRDLFPREKISIGQGVITSMFAAGSVIGLSVGGIIIQEYGWRMTFFMTIPISLLLLFIIRKYIHVENEIVSQARQKRIIEDTANTEETNSSIGESTLNIENNILKINSDENSIDKKSNQKKIRIDIKGAITLAITIISFLLALTLLHSDIGFVPSSQNGFSSAIFRILPFITVGIVSLILFILIEKRTQFPLINLKIFNTTIFFSSLVIMIVGMSMFMVFQTMPILVQTPIPIGFGEDPIATGQIQLPFSIVLLIFGPASGFIISKLGTIKPLILGSLLTTFGFAGLFIFHSEVVHISINLAILSAGLSFASVGAMNVIILATPREYSGVTIGVSSLLRITGASIGPVLASMYMEINQIPLSINGTYTYFPSPFSFDFIFFTAIVLSIISLIFSILVSRKIMKLSIPNLT
jgi:MFS family permease